MIILITNLGICERDYFVLYHARHSLLKYFLIIASFLRLLSRLFLSSVLTSMGLDDTENSPDIPCTSSFTD